MSTLTSTHLPNSIQFNPKLKPIEIAIRTQYVILSCELLRILL